MKNLAVLFLISLLYPALQAADQAHWYRVKTKELRSDGTNYSYFGSSTMTIEDVAKKLQAKEPLLLENLAAWDKDKFVPWTEQNNSVSGQILIMPDNIASIMPLKEDPKATKPTEKNGKNNAPSPDL